MISTFLQRYFLSALFIGLRVGGLMTFAPFFGSLTIPPRVKAGLTVAITILLVPGDPVRPLQLSATSWMVTALGEAMLGILMGLAVQFVFDGFQLAGAVVGVQMGFELENMFDPQTSASSSVVAVFYQTIAVLIFLELNVHQWLLLALGQSFRLVPVGTMVLGPGAVKELFHAAESMWVVGVEISAPVLVATMAVDLTLSFLSRISPEVPVLLVGLSVKQLLGCAVMVTVIALWPAYLQERFLDAIAVSERILHLVH